MDRTKAVAVAVLFLFVLAVGSWLWKTIVDTENAAVELIVFGLAILLAVVVTVPRNVVSNALFSAIRFVLRGLPENVRDVVSITIALTLAFVVTATITYNIGFVILYMLLYSVTTTVMILLDAIRVLLGNKRAGMRLLIRITEAILIFILYFSSAMLVFTLSDIVPLPYLLSAYVWIYTITASFFLHRLGIVEKTLVEELRDSIAKGLVRNFYR